MRRYLLCLAYMPMALAGSPLVLRVRMPDGAVRRVNADASDTLNCILDKLGSSAAVGLAKSVDGPIEAASTQLEELSLKNGDFLYALQGSDAAAAAAESRAKKAAELRSAVAKSQKAKDASAWQPFPQLARPPPPVGPIKNVADLEAKMAQTYKLVPQKKGRIARLSIDPSCFETFVDDLQASQYTPHRCAALYGTVNTGDSSVRVEAMYMAAAGDDGDEYDPTPLLENGAAAGILRATQVACLLGLQPVGWCLSHDSRKHLLGGRDVATAAALQLRTMQDEALGRDKGAYCATVTVSVDRATGDAQTMAYGLSDLAVQMASDGVFAAPMEQTDAAGPTITTTEPVLDGKESSKQPETVSLTVNMPIVEHKGFLRSKFAQQHAGGGKSSPAALKELRKCLFKGGVVPKPSAFLKRISDFALLVYLAGELGMGDDFAELCRCVREGESSNAVVDKYRSSLYALCSQEQA